MLYKLPPFLPDQAPNGDVLSVCRNVIPAANDRYLAVGGFQSISEALPDTFLGGASFVSTGGTAFLLAGTASTLSRLSGGTWTSLLTGLSLATRWKFVQFGDFVVCLNGSTTQEVDLNAGTASALSGAPTAIDGCVVGDYVVVAQPNGDISKVRWSAFNDHTGWTNGTDQAGEQPMLTGGEVMGVVGGEFGVILQRQRLVRMSRTGDATGPFQFDEISDNIGCASKASIAPVGKTVFFLSDRGFMALDDGQAPRPIGKEKFDQSFRDELGEDQFERVWAAVDPKSTRVYWGIPGGTGTVWGYDWALDRAFTLSLPFDGLFAGFENSTDLDSLTATYPDLDAMPYTLDDPRWSGGAPRFYLVQDGEVGTLTGGNLTATFKSSNIAMGKRARVRAMWPETDATSGVSLTITEKQRRGDGGKVRTASNMQTSGRIPLRANGKFLDLTMVIDEPTWTYAEGVTFEASAGGIR